MTAWEGSQIRTAGGHLITPTGICAARITVNDWTHPTTFVILQQFSQDVIFGLDFLKQHGVIIDLKLRSITLSEDQAIPLESSRGHRALTALDDQVSLPPRCRIIISVGTQTPADVKAVIEGDQRLLLDGEIGVARGIARLHRLKAKVMLRNFSQELKRVNKGMTIAYMEEILETKTSNAFALSHSAAST